MSETVTTTNRYGRTRTWILPAPEAVAAYRAAVVSAPTSLVPGMTGLESVAAMAYMATLPMIRDRSVVDTWAALPQPVRAEWLARARRPEETP